MNITTKKMGMNDCLKSRMRQYLVFMKTGGKTSHSSGNLQVENEMLQPLRESGMDGKGLKKTWQKRLSGLTGSSRPLFSFAIGRDWRR